MAFTDAEMAVLSKLVYNNDIISNNMCLPLRIILDKQKNDLLEELGIEWDTIANLGRLLKTEVVLDFACRLDKNVSFLRDTANEFENVEKSINSMLG